MRPVIFSIPLPWGGSLPLHGYGLMIVLGFFLLSWVATRESRRRGLPDFAYDLGLVMLFSGVLGGRLFYYLENYRAQYAGESLLEFFKIWKGGLVFYGGAIGGIAGGWLYIRHRRWPLADCMDVMAMVAPVGMAFGRIGCYLNGCCYGGLAGEGCPLGVRFPMGSPAAQAHHADGWIFTLGQGPSLAVHPVQLYQAAHDLLLAGLLLWYLRRGGTGQGVSPGPARAPRGIGMPLLFLLYGIGRFTLEGLRGDNPLTFSGLTISQNISIGLGVGALLAVALILLKERREGRQGGSRGMTENLQNTR